MKARQRLLANTLIHPRRVLGSTFAVIFVLMCVTNYLIGSFWWGAIPAAMVLVSALFGSLSTWVVMVDLSVKRTGDHPDVFRFELASYIKHLDPRKKHIVLCTETSSWPFTVNDAPCAQPFGHKGKHKDANGNEWGGE